MVVVMGAEKRKTGVEVEDFNLVVACVARAGDVRLAPTRWPAGTKRTGTRRTGGCPARPTRAGCTVEYRASWKGKARQKKWSKRSV